MAEVRCPKCGGLNPADRRYCKYCGINLGDYLLRNRVKNPAKPSKLLAKIRKWLQR